MAKEKIMGDTCENIGQLCQEQAKIPTRSNCECLAELGFELRELDYKLDKLKAAKKKSEYVFLKYIFDSQSEPDKKANFSVEQLATASRQGLIDRHVYALGGINLDNVRMMKDLGFGGVVLCGDLWNRFDIHQEQDFRELIAHFIKIRKAIG
jgi:thiamine-phosphate pyrophosphorylase